jgi:hypothetical protein
VLGIFAVAFKSDVLTDDDEIKQRMIVILKQAQVSTNPAYSSYRILEPKSVIPVI